MPQNATLSYEEQAAAIRTLIVDRWSTTCDVKGWDAWPGNLILLLHDYVKAHPELDSRLAAGLNALTTTMTTEDFHVRLMELLATKQEKTKLAYIDRILAQETKEFSLPTAEEDKAMIVSVWVRLDKPNEAGLASAIYTVPSFDRATYTTLAQDLAKNTPTNKLSPAELNLIRHNLSYITQSPRLLANLDEALKPEDNQAILEFKRKNGITPLTGEYTQQMHAIALMQVENTLYRNNAYHTLCAAINKDWPKGHYSDEGAFYTPPADLNIAFHLHDQTEKYDALYDARIDFINEMSDHLPQYAMPKDPGFAQILDREQKYTDIAMESYEILRLEQGTQNEYHPSQSYSISKPNANDKNGIRERLQELSGDLKFLQEKKLPLTPELATSVANALCEATADRMGLDKTDAQAVAAWNSCKDLFLALKPQEANPTEPQAPAHKSRSAFPSSQHPAK